MSQKQKVRSHANTGKHRTKRPPNKAPRYITDGRNGLKKGLANMLVKLGEFFGSSPAQLDPQIKNELR